MIWSLDPFVGINICRITEAIFLDKGLDGLISWVLSRAVMYDGTCVQHTRQAMKSDFPCR